MTGKVLSLGDGGGSVAKMVVEDLFPLQFLHDFAVEDVLVRPRPNTTSICPQDEERCRVGVLPPG